MHISHRHEKIFKVDSSSMTTVKYSEKLGTKRIVANLYDATTYDSKQTKAFDRYKEMYKKEKKGGGTEVRKCV